MNEKKLKELIMKRESEVVEFKPSLSQINEIVQTVCSFANNKGGTILIGVSDNGEILGCDIGRDSVERLTNKIIDNIDYKIYPKISFEEIENKKVIVIEIEEEKHKPYTAFGRGYVRVGKNNKLMSKSEYDKLVLERHEQEFDSAICKNATLDDVDFNFVNLFFIPKYELITETKMASNIKELLEALGCIKDIKPTNAGILLFGKNPQKFFMNTYIALARYKGKAVEAKRLDYKEFTGNLFQQIDNCDKYIKEHMAIMSKLHPDRVEREDIPEYPFFSIRELVVNAAGHRDYAEQRSKIIIKMFDNKIEYYNPGGLPEGINPDNITKKQFSRNPIIAKVLSKVRYIEDVGEGWDKIVEEHKRHSLKPKLPKIEADKSSVLVTLFSTKEKFEDERKRFILNERQREIIRFIKEHGRITTSSCASLLAVSNDTALRELTKLKDLSLIKIKGIGRSVYYVIK